MTYEELPGVNFSTLKYLDISPKMLKWRETHPEPERDCFDLGDALHVARLEPERFAREYVVEPDFGVHYTADGKEATNPKLTKSYKQAREAWLSDLPPGARIVEAEHMDIVRQCLASLKEHKEADALLASGVQERVITWTDPETGLACKARADVSDRCIVDLKGTHHVTIRGFVNDAARLLYYCQMAYYDWGAKLAGIIPQDAHEPYIVSVQTSEPYDVVAYWLPIDALEMGMKRCREWLNRYAACQQTGWWPGLAAQAIPMHLPSWVFYRTDEEEL